jgi:branched-chain amino acid transport system substrate-binding protein
LRLLSKRLKELELKLKVQFHYLQKSKDTQYGVAYPAQWDASLDYSPETAQKLGIEWFGPTKEEWMNYFKQECPDLIAPSYQAAQAGGTIVFLVKAIEAAGTLDNDAVRQAMNNLEFLSFFGKEKIDPETGLQIGHQMVVVQWQNGKQIVIYPEEVAKAKPLFMAPEWWPQQTTTEQTTTQTEEQTTSSQTTTEEESKGGSNTLLYTTAIIIVVLIIIAGIWFAMKK